MKTKEEVDYQSQYARGAASLLILALLLWAFAAVSPVAASSDPIQQAIDADAARYQALGEFYLAQGDGSPLAASQQGIDADAARYQALGEFYLAQAEGEPVAALQRGIDADAARYQALGEFYLAQAGDSLMAVKSQMPYTDVSKFYVERLRAQIREASALVDNSELASDPELIFARRFYRVPPSILAANPELMFARRFYSAPLSVLAANPELILARRGYSQSAIACSLDDDRMYDDPALMEAQANC